jgi:dCMP deaminase
MRISWNEYFLKCMDAAALRASCDRGKSACIIVKDNRILATGYVGAPSGIPSCDEIGHQLVKRFEVSQQEWELMEDGKAATLIPNHHFSTHCIRTVHAEQNAIINCARNGISTLGATMYVTMTPCSVCARMIIQAGIEKVIARNKYQKDSETRFLFGLAGIELTILEEKELY